MHQKLRSYDDIISNTGPPTARATAPTAFSLKKPLSAARTGDGGKITETAQFNG
jgi:hypothetical protein